MAENPIAKVEEKKPSSYLNLLHIALDTYDDIFSDFDPSEYDHRILSDDFIKEMQKRYTETRKGAIEVRFTIPSSVRSAKVEALIKKRMKEYFQHQVKLLEIEIETRKKAGIVYFAVGFFVLMFIVYSNEILSDFHLGEILALLLTPLGWFGMWEGVGLFVKSPVKYEDQKRFYTRFSKANYVFLDEDEFIRELAAVKVMEIPKDENKEKK